MPKKLALVRWLEDEMVGVMPLTAAKDDPSTIFPGTKTMMKWKGKKQYEVQILQVSGEFLGYSILLANDPFKVGNRGHTNRVKRSS